MGAIDDSHAACTNLLDYAVMSQYLPNAGGGNWHSEECYIGKEVNALRRFTGKDCEKPTPRQPPIDKWCPWGVQSDCASPAESVGQFRFREASWL